MHTYIQSVGYIIAYIYYYIKNMYRYRFYYVGFQIPDHFLGSKKQCFLAVGPWNIKCSNGFYHLWFGLYLLHHDELRGSTYVFVPKSLFMVWFLYFPLRNFVGPLVYVFQYLFLWSGFFHHKELCGSTCVFVPKSLFMVWFLYSTIRELRGFTCVCIPKSLLMVWFL